MNQTCVVRLVICRKMCLLLVRMFWTVNKSSGLTCWSDILLWLAAPFIIFTLLYLHLWAATWILRVTPPHQSKPFSCFTHSWTEKFYVVLQANISPHTVTRMCWGELQRCRFFSLAHLDTFLIRTPILALIQGHVDAVSHSQNQTHRGRGYSKGKKGRNHLMNVFTNFRRHVYFWNWIISSTGCSQQRAEVNTNKHGLFTSEICFATSEKNEFYEFHYFLLNISQKISHIFLPFTHTGE